MYCYCKKRESIGSDFLKSELSRPRFMYESNLECINNRFVDQLKVIDFREKLSPKEVHYYDYSVNALAAAGVPVSPEKMYYSPSLDEVISQVERVDSMLETYLNSVNSSQNESVEV